MIPDLQSALAEVSSGNLVTGLEFELAKVSAPEDCYSEALIRAVAAVRPSEQEAIKSKLRVKFSKDFSAKRFSLLVQEAKAELVALADSPSKLLTSETGATKPILANAIIALRSSSLKVGFDSFSSVVTHQSLSPWGTRERWRDLDDVSAANHLQHAGVTVSSATANEAAFYLAHQNAYHPVRDWLAKLKWDGTPRLEDMASTYFGCPDSEYTRAVSLAWPMSAVARIMRPGCQVKYMIVLEGPQDQGKSRALRALTNGHLDGDSGVQWFRDSLPDIDKDDIGLYMQGVWIIEIAELSAIRGKQWERTKAFLSSQSDTFRRKFGRNMQDYPRQCVFAGSTNEDQWGGDATGLTRFWPLRPDHINVDCILRDRDQLWAEACTYYDEGRPWWLGKEADKLARIEQDQRTPEDPMIERISKAIDALIGFGNDDVSVGEIMDKMGVHEDKKKAEGPAIGRALRRMGWELQPRVRQGDGSQPRRYRRMEN